MNSDDIKNAILKVPPFTRYYIIGVILITFLISYPIIQIAPYIILDYDLSFKKLQVWRLLSNFLIFGKFSFFFIFFLLMTYNVWRDFEDKAILNKKYSEFTMMLLYLIGFLLLLNFFILEKVFLTMELLFSLMYVDSKRAPDKPVSLYGFKMKNAYLPFAFLALTILTGGDLLGNIIGIACGHIYYYLKDIVPITFKKDFLITPGFAERYLDNPNSQLYRPTVDSQGSADSFGNRWQNNNSNNNDNRGPGPGNSGSGANSSGRGFSSFSGSGRTFS